MFLGSRALPVPRVDNVTAICEPILYKMWDPQPQPYGPPWPVTGIALLYFLEPEGSLLPTPNRY
jgi:hypothetical protein